MRRDRFGVHREGGFGKAPRRLAPRVERNKGLGDDFRRATFTQLGDEQQPSSALMAVEV
jgi:hypothetical protein